MLTRRSFLGTAPAALFAPKLYAAPQAKKKLAVVTNVWTQGSHAWHMAERFLHGYPVEGRWHSPPFEVVSAYVDQQPATDLSRTRATEFGFTISKSVADALCCGGEKLAVDAVLVIGEHGKYPRNEFNQIQYPRYDYFKQAVDVFQKAGRAVPYFNDKHLSYRFDWAKAMVDTAKRLRFPLLAGSSLPVTWRMPQIDMPHGAEVEEAMCVAFGGIDVYDFHAHETIQCMVERRKGGESGVAAVTGLKGEAVWKLLAEDGLASLFEACLCRSQTLAQFSDTSDRHPTLDQMKKMVREPVMHRVEYVDGLKSSMLLLNGLVKDFTFAARLKGEKKPISVLFHLPPNPNVTYSAALMERAEEMFLTGKSPYPIERTLLTSGINEAGLKSMASEGKRIGTPHLSVRYGVPKESLFWRT